MVKNIPCRPLHRIRVLSPRPRSPSIPSWRTTSRAASAAHRCVSIQLASFQSGRSYLQYDTFVSLTWRYVLTTRRELETESDATDAQKPMKASRESQTNRAPSDGSGIASLRPLYYHGRRQS
jgi:hypothetical protein